ncbi:MAG: RagB/SusD family nutrient uptake outer membrane protein [Tannerella sp.]|jgi:hypothetical protein|nr:RagB/SusD family nutrient uptake outer membrane protein [Tannerella sp.]
MKKNIILLIISNLLLISCHGDLDVIQTSQVSASSMWREEGDATSAMYGLMNRYRSAFNTAYIYWGEYRTGLWGEGLTSALDYDQTYQNSMTPAHSMCNWADIYTTINAANLVLKYTPDISFASEIQKNRVIANAYFVRAFCYYWIGRIWGDAPLLLEGFESDKQEGLFPTRESADKVFAQVGLDIDAALALMPTSVTDRNLPSQGALNILKADYNLWLYKVRNGGATALSNAASAVNTVLNNSMYSLEDDFSSIFENELGPEIIFALSFIQDEYTGGAASDWLVPSQYISPEYIEHPVKVGSHQQWCFFTSDYKTLLSENEDDQRTTVSFETFFDDKKNGTFQWINKFCGHWVNETRIFDSDIIFYRYADAVLFDAEIKNANNDRAGAITALNKIAKRAYGKDNYYSSSLSTDEINDAILNERLKEFAAEGKLWWDYIRMGVAFKRNSYLTGRENVQNVLLWPVSQTSINQNPNITQTPGYDK